MKKYKNREEILKSMEDEVNYLNKNFGVFPQVFEDEIRETEQIDPEQQLKNAVWKESQPEITSRSFTCNFIDVNPSIKEVGENQEESDYDSDIGPLEYSWISTQQRRRLMMKKHKRQKRKKMMRTLLEKIKKNKNK